MNITLQGKAIFRLKITFIVFILTLSSASAAENATPPGHTANPVELNIGIGIELMNGETTYSIGGPVVYIDGSSIPGYFPISKLEWPLDTWLARVDASLIAGASWRINGSLKTDINDPGDNMTDKDWLNSANPAQLDVYSESSISDFASLIWDIDLEWIFMQNRSWSLYTGLGYQYQNFEYNGKLIHQFSPSGLSSVELVGDGTVGIFYEMTYRMPYALIGADMFITSNFTLSGSFSYSPWVDAEDEDHHLKRVPSRIARGDMDGNAYIFDVSGKYSFSSPWSIEGGIHYTKIDVDGHQNISLNGLQALTERAEAESSQTSGYLKISYRF